MNSKNSPCNGCTERFTACSDNCPKDARGEYGYKAWKADLKKQKAAEREYKKQRREDWMRSDEHECGKQTYAKSKNGRIGGNIYGRK